MEVKVKDTIRIPIGIALVVSLILLILSFGCQQQAIVGITEEEAKVLMDRYMETMNKPNFDLIDEIFSPEFVLRTPVLPEPIEGIEGYKGFITNTVNTFSDFNVTIDELVVKGEKIWGRFTMTGINTGPLGELPATGKKFQITGLAITRVVDGKIAEDETFWNVLNFYQQLGFTLTPPQ